ncbi:thioredoxin family protein [Micromonospora sediminicola]|uniref:thioredoxin family protein n=1 Tax=Micromonospora sediminicola TaxID=946078 RepID=UPI0037989ED7
MTRILYFTAEWCGPCRKFGPVLAAQASARCLDVERVDIDADPGLAQAHNVMSVPTVVVVTDGEAVDRFGAIAPTALRDRLEAACGR